ncbi:hypothetical protein AD951_08360 [Acetobacter malorum]|uniref:Type IV secretion system putative lipoprotein virB7 n=1 Tax=Acetobacter malorum TaxID=178901 RepID=A0A149UM85_9PROT|nr:MULTISPECIES: hypothetical protein [Acetobacter]KXV69042.1 hypothetical protein AD951_08360 [Acetobacter malorum]MBS1017102.1 hypothetical protein [Acetobacter persici]
MKRIVILFLPLVVLAACSEAPDPKLTLEHPHQVLLGLAPGRVMAANLYSSAPLRTPLYVSPFEPAKGMQAMQRPAQPYCKIGQY